MFITAGEREREIEVTDLVKVYKKNTYMHTYLMKNTWFHTNTNAHSHAHARPCTHTHTNANILYYYTTAKHPKLKK